MLLIVVVPLSDGLFARESIDKSDPNYGKAYWQKWRDYPDCRPHVETYWRQTEELIALDQRARRTLSPEQYAVVEELNAKAEIRLQTMKRIRECGWVTLPNIGRKRCVPRSKWLKVDHQISACGLNQTGKTIHDSFNCFFYAHTYIEGAVPKDVLPGNDYFEDPYLRQHGYSFYNTVRDLTGDNRKPGEGFAVGDIIVSPLVVEGASWLDFLLRGQLYSHVAIVVETDARGGIRRIRQKIDPWKCVVDLSPAEFQRVYGIVDKSYKIWRRQ